MDWILYRCKQSSMQAWPCKMQVLSVVLLKGTSAFHLTINGDKILPCKTQVLSVVLLKGTCTTASLREVDALSPLNE